MKAAPIIPLSDYEREIASTRALEELDRLDRESDFFALQCDFRRAAPIAREYAKLKRKLEAAGVDVPVSVTLRR